MKAHIVSLGCPKNLTDSEVILGQLSCAGYKITQNIKTADLVVINTCAFLKSAREESFSEIKKAFAQKKKGAKLYVAGCLPKLSKNKLPTKTGKMIDGIIESIDVFDSHTPRIKATNKWTAYVKISEGCNNKCAYCLIPKIRGRLKTRPVNDIVKEVTALSKRGVKEIIFVAQDTTAHPKFTALLQKTSKIKKIEWIRIMYTHPKHITPKLIKFMAKNKKICKYLDLPLQHIYNDVLRRMGRGVSRQYIENLIKELRRQIKGLAIRTSFIVGFPGESQEAFLDLACFVEKEKFERLGVFTYSREAGTPAANMRGQVSEKVKRFRFQKIMALQKKISLEMNRKLIGNIVEVLLEKKSGKSFVGRTYMDAPDVDCSVEVLNSGLGLGEIVKARVIKASPYSLTAEYVT